MDKKTRPVQTCWQKNTVVVKNTRQCMTGGNEKGANRAYKLRSNAVVENPIKLLEKIILLGELLAKKNTLFNAVWTMGKTYYIRY